jgi:hypothetical protein
MSKEHLVEQITSIIQDVELQGDRDSYISRFAAQETAEEIVKFLRKEVNKIFEEAELNR